MTSQPWKRRVVLGDGRVVLYEGDCLEILPHLEGVDAVVTDPPYGIGYQRGSGGRAGKYPNARRNDLALVGDSEPFDPSPWARWPCAMFGADHFCQLLPCDGVMHVWDKHCGRAGEDDFSDAELIWCSKRAKRRVLRYLWKGLQQEGGGEWLSRGVRARRYHPTQKPIAAMAFCLRLFPEAHTILDPYMGSGTTGVAAVQLGRRFIGVEIEPKYFDIAAERITHALAQPRLFNDEPAPTQEALI